MNSLITKYRELVPDDERTDRELMLALGEEAASNGVLESQPPDFIADYRRLKDAMVPGVKDSLVTGLKSGVRGIGSSLAGAGALVADWLPGSGTDEYIRDPLLRESEKLQAPRKGETHLTWDDVQSPKSLASYLAYQTGNAIPSVAESLLVTFATGGFGGVAEGAASAALKELAKSKVMKRVMLAQGANSLMLSAGELFGDLANDPKIDKDTARDLASGLGVIAAIPDTILPTYIASKFIQPAKDEAERVLRRDFLKAVGKEALKTAPGEAGTEAFQEWVGVMAGKLAKGEGMGLNENDWKRMREAAVGGAIGGTIAAPVATYGKMQHDDGPKTDVTPVAETAAAKPRIPAPVVDEEAAQPGVETREQMARRVSAMSDEEMVNRFAALNKLAKLSPIEERERDFIEALNATKWKQQATPTTNSPDATLNPTAAPAAPTATQPGEGAAPAPAAVPAPVAPEEATPETPVAAVQAPAPMTATQIMQRTERISNRIARLVERGADVREIKRKQGLMAESGVFTRDAFKELEAALDQAEVADAAVRAKVKTGDAKFISDREKEIAAAKSSLAKQKKDAVTAIRKEVEQKRQSNVYAKLTEQLAKLYPATTPQESDGGAGSAPNLGSGAEAAPAPVVFNAGALLNPHVDFSSLSLEEAKSKDWVGAFTKAFAVKPLSGRADKGTGMRTSGSNASQTTVAIGFLDPKTGMVHQRGLMRNMDVQSIAKYAEGTKRGDPKTRYLNPNGSIPMSLKEVTEQDYIPIGESHFTKAGRINQDFASKEEYLAAAQATPIESADLAKSNATKLEAQAKADAERASTPAGAAAVIRKQKNAAKAKSSAVNVVGEIEDTEGETTAPTSEGKENTTYGVGPWQIRHGDKVVSEINLAEVKRAIEPPKEGSKAKPGKFAEFIRDKSGTFTIVDSNGNEVVTVTQKRATKRKVTSAPVAAITSEELSRAYKLLSEVEQVTNDKGEVTGESINWAKTLHDMTKGKSQEEADSIVRDFLLGKGDFGMDGKNYSAMIGGYKKARASIQDVLANYEKLSEPAKGNLSAQPDKGAGATGGQRVPAKRARKSGGSKGDESLGSKGKGTGDQDGRSDSRGARGDDGRELPELDLEGRPLGESELKDAALNGIYNATSLFGKGVFSAELLRKFPANVREAVTDLLAERNMEWDDFQSYIQSSFDASNTAEDFLAIMRGEEPGAGTKASMESDAAEYTRIQSEMKELGHDKVGTDEYQSLWQQSEDIKNRNGGMPPTYGESVPSHETVGGFGATNVINPLTGKLESPYAVPNTVRAIEYNAAEADRRAKQSRIDESSPASLEWVDAPPPDQSLQRRIDEIAQDLSNQNASDSVGSRTRPPAVRITAQSPVNPGAAGRSLNFVTAAELIGKVFKKRIVFVKIEGGRPGLAYRGLTSKASDVILINVISGVSTLKLIGHELTHNLKYQQDQLYRSLASYILVRFPPPAGYRQDRIDAGYNAGEVNEEWVSDIVGENFADPEFWKEFKAQAKTEEQNLQIRNLATYMGGWVSRIFQSFKRVLNRQSAEVAQAAKLQKVIADVMSQYAGADQLAAPMLAESDDILSTRASKETLGDDETFDRMRMDAAVINEIVPTYEEAHRALAPNETFEAFMKSVLWKSDLPEAQLEKIEKIARGTRQTKLADINQQQRAHAVATAYALIRKNEDNARSAAAAASIKLGDLSEEVTKAGKRILKIERSYQDSSLMNDHFHQELKELITGVALDETRKSSAAYKLGELTQAVRTLESLSEEAPIPAEYQKVFERIITSDTTSVFDHLQAIAKLNLPLSDLSVKGVFDAMAASGVPALTNLTAANKPLAVALAALARTNQKEMDLLQVRVMAATAQKVESKRVLDDITTASDERLDALWTAYEKMQKSNDVFARLAARYIRDRRELRRKQTELRKQAAKESLLSEFARRLEEKRTELGKEAGDYVSWAAEDRGTYSSMRMNKEGKWVETKRTLYLSGADAEKHGPQLHADLAANKAWLGLHPNLKGTQLYNNIEAQWEQLSRINFLRIAKPAHRWFADKFLSSVSERFRLMGGVAPVAVSQMLQRYQFIDKQGGDGRNTWHDRIQANAKRYNVALNNLVKAAGFRAPKEMELMRDQVINYLESQTGKDIDSAVRGASRVARRYIPASNKISEDFAEKLREYVHRLDEANGYMLKVAESNGTYVEDAGIKGWLRKAIPRGAITVSRRIRTEQIVEAVEVMDAAKWEPKHSFVNQEDQTVLDPSTLSVFTPEVMRHAVIPFILKNGTPMFFGAERTNGEWSYLSQLQAQRAWENSDKTVLGWINEMFDGSYMPGPDADMKQDRNDYQLAILAKLNGNAALLRNTFKKITEKSPRNPEGGIPLPHRLQDGRSNDLLPAEFLKYDTFDEVNSEIMLKEIAYHAAFGRDGARVDALLRQGGAIESELQGRARDYSRLRGLTEAEKRRDAIARGWDWKRLRQAQSDLNNFNSLRAGFYNRFGMNGMEPGAETAAWEGIKTIAALVLNQPTSGLWNIPTLLDFPLVVGGALGVKSSMRSMIHLGKGMIGSPASALGINLFRMSDYWTTIVNARHSASKELSRSEHMTAIGKDANYSEGGAANKATQVSRYIQNLMKRGFKTGNGQLPFNGLWAPFNFIGESVTLAVATANVENVEMMVKRAAEFFNNNADALNDPTYKLTAKDLKMNGPAYFNDERAFEYYTQKLGDFHLGSLENMAREAMGRSRILTDEQVMMVTQMAFNEISLESSLNSRPMGWAENPVMRYGGLMLGWPIMQMDKTHRAFKTQDGQTWNPAAMGRAIGVMALWTLPMGLAFSLLMDDWDEDIVGKRSNRRDIDGVAAIPIVGPAAALAFGKRSAENNLFSMMERASKAGVYGLGLDVISGMTNIVDSKAGQREFSLDSRVLAFSQFTTLSNVFRNLIHQDGTYTYESVGRPLFMALGGNGLIQGMQIVSNIADLNTEERLIATRIGVGNYLRAAGRDADVPLKAGAGRASPTPVSAWEREMYLAAIGNDRTRFLESYRAAVAAAREMGDEDPENTVLQGWKRRSPVESVFAHKPTDDEMARILNAMDEKGRRAVSEVTRLYDDYTYLIEPTAAERMIKRQVSMATRMPRPPASLFR